MFLNIILHDVFFKGSLYFGDCIQQPHDSQPGQMVTAKFVSGHLRNDLLTGDSFLRVEHNEVNI